MGSISIPQKSVYASMVLYTFVVLVTWEAEAGSSEGQPIQHNETQFLEKKKQRKEEREERKRGKKCYRSWVW